MYRFGQWLAFFYIYSVIGWLWESGYVSFCKRKPVNRGFLYGPFIPLYGTGALVMLIAVLPLKENLLLVYLGGLTAATLLELFTGWLMERIFCVKYWDYSAHRFQLHGYIWLVSSLFWGFLSIILVKWIHRPIEQLVCSVPTDALLVIEGIVTGIFALDVAKSVQTALHLRTVLQNAQKLHTQLTQLRSELEAHAEAHYATARQNIADRRDMAHQRLHNRVAALQQQHDQHLQHLFDLRSRLHERYPSLSLGGLESPLHEWLQHRHDKDESTPD